jgi:carbonic anhydrase/acetyltransferase-like protein (isoleucine patch superfamily)
VTNGSLILSYRNILPRIDPSAFIAPGVVITGDVEIGAHANIWFGVVIRGDDAPVRIGARANIQDGCVLHVTFDGTERIPCIVGDDVAVGHMALLHGCRLEPGAFIGMKACVMDRAVVESGAMVAAGALVAPRKVVKSGELWSGTPARLTRLLKPEEQEYMRWVPQHYGRLAEEYRNRAVAQRG